MNILIENFNANDFVGYFALPVCKIFIQQSLLNIKFVGLYSSQLIDF